MSTHSGTTTGTASRVAFRRSSARLVAALVAFAALAIVTQTAVDHRIREQVASLLQSSVRTATVALDLWRESVEAHISALTSRPKFRQLLARHLDSSEPLTASEQAEFDQLLTFLVSGAQADGFLITNREGKIAEATNPKLVGRAPALPEQAYRKWLAQPTTTVWSPEFLQAEDGKAPSPYLVFTMPIESEGRHLGAVHLLMRADRRFSEIMSYSRPGKTAETYAFDIQGRLISESRFRDQLADAGLLSGAAKSPILRVDVRDPGSNLSKGQPAAQPRSQQPLTLPVKRALAGTTQGYDVDGYNDYRGEPVVGAWYYAPQYRLGIVTEIDVSEAFALRSWLRAVLAAIGATFVAMIVVAVWVAHRNMQWENRSRKAEAKAARLGQYTLTKKLGEGGMGAVYMARHALLRRPTAVKLIRAPEGREISQAAFARFEREVQHTASLTHPNTISVYDYGRTPDGTFYYAMEYLDGLDLEELVARTGPLPPDRARYLLLQACGSLAEAHDDGMVHRDIKPSNLMVCKRGGEYDRIKVLDFGLVKSLSPEAKDATVTQQGAIAGTPMYMAPESVRDVELARPHSDVYALGAVLYFLISGEVLFPNKDPLTVMVAQMTQEPRRLSSLATGVSEALDSVVHLCLEKDPAKRPQNARELARMLQRLGPIEWDSDAAAEWWRQHPDVLRTVPSEEPGAPTSEPPKTLQTVTLSDLAESSGDLGTDQTVVQAPNDRAKVGVRRG